MVILLDTSLPLQSLPSRVSVWKVLFSTTHLFAEKIPNRVSVRDHSLDSPAFSREFFPDDSIPDVSASSGRTAIAALHARLTEELTNDDTGSLHPVIRWAAIEEVQRVESERHHRGFVDRPVQELADIDKALPSLIPLCQ